MFNTTIHQHHYTRSGPSFPSTVHVHEHRAPTNESAALLYKLEQKALDNVVLKISELRPNKFSYNVFFSSLFCTGDDDCFCMQKGVVILEFNCNGKVYKRRVTCSSDTLSMARKYGPEANLCDLDVKLQRFILFEMSFLIAQVLLELDEGRLQELFNQSSMTGAVKFDLDTLKEELEYS